jgi:cytoskeletal protein CcmA (bactofilin family)
MKEIYDEIEGDVLLNEDTKLHGMFVGMTTVSSGVTLILHGTVTKDLIVEEDSKVMLHGMVIGDVVNNGGHLEVFGMITGKLIRNRGKSIVDPKAVIEGGLE